MTDTHFINIIFIFLKYLIQTLRTNQSKQIYVENKYKIVENSMACYVDLIEVGTTAICVFNF